jgi:hypothetical protein
VIEKKIVMVNQILNFALFAVVPEHYHPIGELSALSNRKNLLAPMTARRNDDSVGT